MFFLRHSVHIVNKCNYNFMIHWKTVITLTVYFGDSAIQRRSSKWYQDNGERWYSGVPLSRLTKNCKVYGKKVNSSFHHLGTVSVFKLFVFTVVKTEQSCFEQKRVVSMPWYCLNCMKCGKLILRKIIEIVATRCHFEAIMQQIRFRLTALPDP